MSFARSVSIVVCLASSMALAGDQTCVAPGEVLVDGQVDLFDSTLLVICLSGPGVTEPPGGCGAESFEAAAQDGDLDVDLRDAAIHLENFGREYFEYGPHRDNPEAEQLAMHLTGELRAPDEEYFRILGDLALLRDEFPQMGTIIDDPDYVPNQILVGLQSGAPLIEFDALNEFYLVTAVEKSFSFATVTFCDNMNALAVSPEYAELPGLNYAEPNYLIGTDDQITVEVIGTTYRYTIDDGEMDCFDGCDCHTVYVIDVTDEGDITLVSFEQFGQPWCGF